MGKGTKGSKTGRASRAAQSANAARQTSRRAEQQKRSQTLRDKKKIAQLRVHSAFNLNGLKTIYTPPTGATDSVDPVLNRRFTVNRYLCSGSTAHHHNLSFLVRDREDSIAYAEFNRLTTTRDRIGALIKKHSTLMEGYVESKTSDGYSIRVFYMALSGQRQGPGSNYWRTGIITKIREQMGTHIKSQISQKKLVEFVHLSTAPEFFQNVLDGVELAVPCREALVSTIKVLASPIVPGQDFRNSLMPTGASDMGKVKTLNDAAINRIDRPRE